MIWDVPRLVGRYYSYLLPKQAGGTPVIKVNPTQVRQQMGHPVVLNESGIAKTVTVADCHSNRFHSNRRPLYTELCRFVGEELRDSCARTLVPPATPNLYRLVSLHDSHNLSKRKLHC